MADDAATSVAIAGSSGLIGSALVSALRADGHAVTRLVRRTPAKPDERCWNPDTGDVDPRDLAGLDAVVNLCGVNVGGGRWSGAFKQSLRDSRIDPTEVLAAAVARAGVPTLLNASAVGYYGDTRDRAVDETAPPGSGFMARLCQDWEAATAPAAEAGTRVVLSRTGLVLAPKGGLLGRLRPLFALGLGARLGDGRQYMPWITLADQVRALRFALTNTALSGPVNLTGPAPVTNAQFTSALGRALNRPARLVIPGFAARLAVGEFAEEALLSGQRAIPAVLERAGFEFEHNTIGAALAYATGRDQR
ncbi:epimerase [Mycolicibacterium chitae]|uniref:Epimerase family protein n=1 Tax=Mycolicibacterium chitae TaxID=1792 RepID=A0A448I550_MYCCI|nr:TIGR01777 family oxidoreductase [Mycolicibacterium chitae]MCV7106396.1 TIGR01777 family protein [Mycolicibacterium chitae]BBZ03979.1 epimerase [Mycolicibacterium chitae]VEG47631.1 Epimerase family protein [Mycolicibacterium chitae]